MKVILLFALLIPSVALAQIELIRVTPRYVTVTHKECETKHQTPPSLQQAKPQDDF